LGYPQPGTKLLRPLIRYWKGQGTRVLLYLDDGLEVVEVLDNEASKEGASRLGLIANESVGARAEVGFEIKIVH